MAGESPTNPPQQENSPVDTGCGAPFGLPRIPLHRFTIETPLVGWAFLDTYHGLPAWGMHRWTACYLILWNRAAHDDDWFAQHRGDIIWKYDDWEGPHYGDAVVLHEIHLHPGIRPEDRVVSEGDVIRLALSKLRNPIPTDTPVATWQSVQFRETINSGIFFCYQALFLEPENDRDLLRSACLFALWKNHSIHRNRSTGIDPLEPPGIGGLARLLRRGVRPARCFSEDYQDAVAGL